MSHLDRSIPQKFLEQLKSASDRDLRIGQFMEIIRSHCEEDAVDLFTVENKKLVGIIEKWMKKPQ